MNMNGNRYIPELRYDLIQMKTRMVGYNGKELQYVWTLIAVVGGRVM